ncbi:hypothetical protein [Oryza sativa Japonica Group]|uniref:Uncharacterized protein n=1 Tax=Oryza sativa subsp. japonica TaxID=39947 RepID=Q8LJJ4_ORYSJ|nr:hypothetical protein [Oryza sativa Japonica Group]
MKELEQGAGYGGGGAVIVRPHEVELDRALMGRKAGMATAAVRDTEAAAATAWDAEAAAAAAWDVAARDTEAAWR